MDLTACLPALRLDQVRNGRGEKGFHAASCLDEGSTFDLFFSVPCLAHYSTPREREIMSRELAWHFEHFLHEILREYGNFSCRFCFTSELGGRVALSLHALVGS